MDLQDRGIGLKMNVPMNISVPNALEYRCRYPAKIMISLHFSFFLYTLPGLLKHEIFAGLKYQSQTYIRPRGFQIFLLAHFFKTLAPVDVTIARGMYIINIMARDQSKVNTQRAEPLPGPRFPAARSGKEYDIYMNGFAFLGNIVYPWKLCAFHSDIKRANSISGREIPVTQYVPLYPQGSEFEVWMGVSRTPQKACVFWVQRFV